MPPQKIKKFLEENIAFCELLKTMGMGVFRIAAKEGESVLFANGIFCDISGFSEEEILKMSFKDLVRNKQSFRAIKSKVLRTKKGLRDEIILKTNKMQDVVCLLSLVPVKNARGKIEYLDGVIEDISEKQRAGDATRESKELFQSIFNSSALAIMVTDQEGAIVAWNPFTEKMLGMDETELFNKPVNDLYPQEACEKMQAFQIFKKGMVEDIETQVCKKDGTVLDVSVSVSMVKDTSGKVTGSVGFMRDVTRQKKVEQKIRESENALRVILDNSPIAITMSDEKEQIVSWNRHAEELLGMNRKDLLRLPVSSFYPKKEWEKIRAANIRGKGSQHHLETRIIRKDGKEVDVDLSVNILKDEDNKIVGSVGIMQDVTEQKKVQRSMVKAKEAAEAANVSKTMFLANMSHEVRTPMSTIIGMVDLTLDTDLNPEQRENLSTVKNAADILLNLLNDILDLSRVEAGKISLEKININVVNIVKSVCSGLSVLAKDKNLELQWEVGPEVPEVMVGDPVRLRQILVNLINNAIKFTFQGSIVTSVKCLALEKNICELQFSVKDKGVGIAADKIDGIFDVFAQADVSTTRRFGGTGLGLTISRRLIEMMGGRVWVESEEFAGSTFYFTVKLSVGKKKAGVALKEKVVLVKEVITLEEKEKRQQISILLAEDNIVNQKMAVRMLEKKGWIVKSAINGRQVLEYLDQGEFDLILMDAQMPVMDGYEATRMIRKKEEKEGGHIPIIALTARVMSGDKKKCLKCGMDGYVSKPIDRQKLYEVVEKFFNSNKGKKHEGKSY